MKGVLIDRADREWVVYMIVNPIGQLYIGCSCQFKYRIKSYKNGYTSGQPLLHESMTKYGFDSHEIKILDSFKSDKEFSKGKEIFWIRSFMSSRPLWPEQGGLNVSAGGGLSPFLRTKEARDKTKLFFAQNPELLIKRGRAISAAKMGYKPSQETIDKVKETKAEKRGKRILQYALDGSFIAEHRSISEAMKACGVIRNTICEAIRGEVKNPQRFIFRLKE